MRLAALYYISNQDEDLQKRRGEIYSDLHLIVESLNFRAALGASRTQSGQLDPSLNLAGRCLGHSGYRRFRFPERLPCRFRAPRSHAEHSA